MDRGRTVTGLVLDAIAADIGPSPLAGAEAEQDLWAGMRVLADDLTSRVCVLNLPAVGDGPTDGLLRSSPGEPVWLTLRMLLGTPPELATSSVYACENLSVIAEAADRLGPDCGPLVCVAGNPVVAVRQLLDLLVRADVTVASHGDFDWPGVAIAGRVLTRLGRHGRGWRMAAEDYREGLAEGSNLPALGRRREVTPWAPSLAEAMSDAGVAVEEEVVADLLLEDLGS